MFSCSNTCQFILIDWKRGTQSTGLGCGGSVVGEKGLVVSRVTGIPARAEYWKRDNLTCAESQGAVVQLAQGATLNSTGWVRNMDYTFRFVYTEGKFQLFVDDVLQATLSGSFPGGRFCFYNFSQASVRYSGLSRNIIISAPCPS